MKQLSFILPFLLMSPVFFGQTVQGTIKSGSLPNSVIVAIKPSADMINAKISTFYFAVAIPTSVGAAPTVTTLTNFNTNISFEIDAPVVETVNATTYYVYNFRGDGAQTAGTERNYLAAVDNDMMEITISTPGTLNLSDIGIVSLPDGGTTLNSYFNIYNAGTDVTNEAAMFYGTGAVNSALGYTGLSYKLIGVVLPVNFLSFYALNNGEAALLSWTVSNDEENQYFEVERSADGRAYTAFARVSAKANGQNTNNYEVTDPAFTKQGSKEVYYRVKQVDKSGSVKYSMIRTLTIARNLSLSLFPNPVRTITKLVIDVPDETKGTIIIRDINGRQVQMINTLFVKGINQTEINVSMLPAGDYNLTVNSNNLNQTIKFAKQ